MRQDQVQGSLTHVTDVAPTLLELAGIAQPGSSYKGQPIEVMAGRSLMPVLKGEVAQVHPADEAIGYELSGNAALFKGSLKLVKNMAPVGDGQWHLFNLETDAGETEDLQGRMPAQFRAMQSDYEAYAQSHGVLAMPEGYSPTRQVMINSFVNYWIPYYRKPVLIVLAALIAGLGLLHRRRRKQRR